MTSREQIERQLAEDAEFHRAVEGLEKRRAASQAMLKALKTATNYREKGIVLDMMLAAIKQAEDAGITGEE